jgi:ferritin-like metal-binding protein YciE
MSQTSNDVIRHYLEDAIAAEKSFETQLQAFARQGDDEEVEAVFAIHAAETRRQYERLTARLQQLGGSVSTAKSFFAHIFGLAPKPAQVGHAPEERTTQNLVMAFTVENSEYAMYEALAAAAEAAGDTTTETLAREIQAEEKQTAEKIWRFIPSRAKIAFNLLTAAETDPAVNTKAADNRLI